MTTMTTMTGNATVKCRCSRCGGRPLTREEAFVLATFAPPGAHTPCRGSRRLLSRKAANLLAAHGIDTLGDAAERTASEMLGWKGFGQTCLNEVVAALARAGLRLARAEESDPTPLYHRLELSVRARKCLRSLEIETVGQLLSTPRHVLMSVRNFGAVSLAEIDAELERCGLPRIV